MAKDKKQTRKILIVGTILIDVREPAPHTAPVEVSALRQRLERSRFDSAAAAAAGTRMAFSTKKIHFSFECVLFFLEGG